MEKKIKAPRRVSSSSSSSTSSSTSSSSSSSSSYDKKRTRGLSQTRGKKDNSHKREHKRSKKSKFSKFSESSNDLSKLRAKSTLGKYRSSSKGSNRKSSHRTRREYKDIDHDCKFRSTFGQFKRTSSKKHHSKGGKSSLSPKGRLEYHARTIEHSLSHSRDSNACPSHVRDSRNEERFNRSPDILEHDRHGNRLTLKRYEKDDYMNKSDKRSPFVASRSKESRKGHKHREHFSHELEYSDDRFREVIRRDDRDLKVMKGQRERDKGEHDRRVRYLRNSEWDKSKKRSMDAHYSRHPLGADSRENSVERTFDHSYDKYGETERIGFETRGGYNEPAPEDHRTSEDFPAMEEMRFVDDCRRRNALPRESHFSEDRRTVESWKERSSSRIDDLQDKSEMYGHPSCHQVLPPHLGSASQRRSEWIDHREHSRPQQSLPSWNKNVEARRTEDWSTEDYPVEDWRDDANWIQGDRPRVTHIKAPGNNQWDSIHSRFHNTVSEESRGDRGSNSVHDNPSCVVSRKSILKPVVPGVHFAKRHSIGSLRSKNLVQKDQSVHEQDISSTVDSRSGEPLLVPKGLPFLNQTIRNAELEKGDIFHIKQSTDSGFKKLERPITDVPVIEKDNFSDFSDDSDDILNQETSDTVKNFTEETDLEAKTNLVEKKIISYEDILEEEERMELEEISEEEFEEEKQARFSVADALDINWSSLINDSRSFLPTTMGSSINRFNHLHLYSALGISTKYARPNVLKKVCDELFKGLHRKQPEVKEKSKDKLINSNNEDERQYNIPEMSEGENEMRDSSNMRCMMKIFGKENLSNFGLAENDSYTLRGEVVNYTEKGNWNTNFFNFIRNRTSLSAKEELSLRRCFCNFPEDELEFEFFCQHADLFTETFQKFSTCSLVYK